MKFDDFANIMAMYPITPTREISQQFGVAEHIITTYAHGMGVYKKGRKHKVIVPKLLVLYNAVTGEVSYQSKDAYFPKYSNKPIKLKARI